jgi:hypothetical protein
LNFSKINEILKLDSRMGNFAEIEIEKREKSIKNNLETNLLSFYSQ